MHKKKQGVTVKTNYSLLIEGFVKTIVGFTIILYLVGILWYVGKNSVIDVLLMLGLCFRFTFVVNDQIKKWKIFTSLFFYVLVMLDQLYDFYRSKGSLSDIVESSSIILLVALVCILILDLWQLCRSHWVSNRNKEGQSPL